VCCSVLQCVAVCCRVLQCVAVWCSVYDLFHLLSRSVLHCVAACCSVLQRIWHVTHFVTNSNYVSLTPHPLPCLTSSCLTPTILPPIHTHTTTQFRETLNHFWWPKGRHFQKSARYLICSIPNSCRSLSAKKPLIIGLFCGKWPVKIRHLMGQLATWFALYNQYSAYCCSVLHCVAVCCSVLQCVALLYTISIGLTLLTIFTSQICWFAIQHTSTHCNSLQHTAPLCTTLYHTAPYCTILHHTAP